MPSLPAQRSLSSSLACPSKAEVIPSRYLAHELWVGVNCFNLSGWQIEILSAACKAPQCFPGSWKSSFDARVTSLPVVILVGAWRAATEEWGTEDWNEDVGTLQTSLLPASAGRLLSCLYTHSYESERKARPPQTMGIAQARLRFQELW